MTQAILAISFGTSYEDTRKKTIGAIEDDLQAAFPGSGFGRAFTSPTIRRILRERDRVEVDDVEGALARLAAGGYQAVTVQATYVIPGLEYNRTRAALVQARGDFARITCGGPLLDTEGDYREVTRILGQEFRKCRGEHTAVVLMGHGTEHEAGEAYGRLQRMFAVEGMEDFLVGTVEAPNSLEEVIRRAELLGARRVVLAPLMVVAGDHATNDMAGDGPDSWKSGFVREGFSVECVMKGLGQYPGIRRMYVRHAREGETL